MKNVENEKHEHGHEKHVYRFTINDNRYEWHQEHITGAELRKLGHVPPEDEIFLAKRHGRDELIRDDTRVHLKHHEEEHFYSKEKHFKVVLIVNGREKPWHEKTIDFEQVVILAFGSYDPNPNKVYTVTYDRGPHRNPEGSMVKGDKVFVKNKMIFNVTATDKS